MSGIFKAVGKVFKKVAKVVKKVAVPALIVGAIVLTGGAAIGALPSIGSVLGSLGISGTLASVLGGAVSSAAIGAVTNGAMAAISGGNVLKAAVKGGVMGAVTGGVMGGLGMISPNGVLSDMGIGSKLAHLQGLAATGTASPAQLAQLSQLQGGAGHAVGGTMTPVGTTNAPVGRVDVPASTAAQGSSTGMVDGEAPFSEAFANSSYGRGATPQGLIGSAHSSIPTAAAAAPAAAGGGGLLSNAMAPALIQGLGAVVGGLGQGAAMKAQAKDQLAMQRAEYDKTALNYGYQNIYGKDGNAPVGQQQVYQYGAQQLAMPNTPFSSPPPKGYYAIQGNQLVFVQA